jgi:hypothetical protein
VSVVVESFHNEIEQSAKMVDENPIVLILSVKNWQRANNIVKY